MLAKALGMFTCWSWLVWVLPWCAAAGQLVLAVGKAAQETDVMRDLKGPALGTDVEKTGYRCSRRVAAAGLVGGLASRRCVLHEYITAAFLCIRWPWVSLKDEPLFVYDFCPARNGAGHWLPGCIHPSPAVRIISMWTDMIICVCASACVPGAN